MQHSNIEVNSLVFSAIAAVWLVMNRSGIVTASHDAVGLIEMFMVAVVRRIAPELALYAAATRSSRRPSASGGGPKGI